MMQPGRVRMDLSRLRPGTPSYDAAWLAKQAGLLHPAWRRRVLDEHADLCAQFGEYRGNTWIRELADSMRQSSGIALDASDAEIRRAGVEAAAAMFDIASSAPMKTLSGVRAALAAAVEARGIAAPGPEISDEGAVARMFTSAWWVRRLRAAHGRRVEGAAVRLGYVHKRAGCYVSDVSLERRREQRRRNARALESVEVENQNGDTFTLAELAERSNANPRIRRAELMTRISGFEAIAADLGHAAEFWTGTAPSRFHAVRFDGRRNDRHDGSDARAAQAHLVACWARCRAAMQRRGIRAYGFRIAEPHHDGCPHWHLLLWMPAAQVEGARALFRRYFLEDHDADEPGARENRVKFVAIDPRRGTAAGYVAKYVAKNIDGYALGSDLFGNDEITTAARVDAWAATWGIRQFQQIGGAPVGVWRELRRLASEDGLSDVVEAARAAADVGKRAGSETGDAARGWARYVALQGGPMVSRDDLVMRTAYTRQGEKFNPVAMAPEPAENVYGEPAAPSVFGVLDCRGGRAYLSRRLRWVRRVSSKRAARAAWTRVNNCTDGEGDDGNRKRGAGLARGAREVEPGAGACGDGGRGLCRADPGRARGAAGCGAGDRCGKEGGGAWRVRQSAG